MKFVLPIVVSLLLLSVCTVSAAPLDREAAMARARDVRAAVSAGEAATLWPRLSASMQSAMKDSLAFARMSSAIAGQIGEVDSVLAESLDADGDGWSYVAECRFDRAPAPLTLRVHLDAEGRVDGLAVRPGQAPKEAPSPHLEHVTKAKLRLPFDDEWFVVWGGRTIADNYHAATRAQRFAMDLLVRKDGRTHAGEGKQLADYFAYGRTLRSPADATVIAAVDSLPDQPIGGSDRANPAGNFVLLDLGTGEYLLMAHLQPKSLKVRVGQRVKAGQPIGLCGNSGNTSEPHLHLHVQDSPVPLEGDGMPAFFRDVLVDGVRTASTELGRGKRVAPAR